MYNLKATSNVKQTIRVFSAKKKKKNEDYTVLDLGKVIILTP